MKNTLKIVLTEKFIALNTYISREEDVKLKKKKTLKIKTLIFYLRKPEKEEQFKPNQTHKKRNNTN